MNEESTAGDAFTANMELGTVTVKSILTPEGDRGYTVAYTPGMAAMDIVGLLESAKLAFYEQHMTG